MTISLETFSKLLLLLFFGILTLHILSVAACIPNSPTPDYPLPKFNIKKEIDPWFHASSFSRVLSSLSNCECGKSLSGRIKLPLRTVPAGKHEFPWQVLIRVHLEKHNLLPNGTKSKDHYYCGGTIINDLFILTSCQCVLQYDPGEGIVLNLNATNKLILPRQIKIWTDLTDRESITDSNARTVEKIIYHPKFPKKADGDIALLKLKNRIRFSNTSSLRPVCLPFSTGANPDTRGLLYKTDSKVGVGWISEISPSTEVESNLLKKVDVNIANCPLQDQTPESFGYSNYFCTPHYTRSNPKLLHNMDTGSSLIVTDEDKKVQVGILSWISKVSDIDAETFKNIRLFTRITSPDILSFIDYISDKEGASWCTDPVKIATTTEKSDISSSTLPGTNVGSSTLPGTNVGSSTLPGTNVGSSTLPGTNVGSSTLPGTNVGSSTLPGTNVGSSTLPGTNVGSSTLPTGTTGGSSTLPGTNVGSSTLPGTNVGSSTLPGTNVGSSTLPTGTTGGSSTLPTGTIGGLSTSPGTNGGSNTLPVTTETSTSTSSNDGTLSTTSQTKDESTSSATASTPTVSKIINQRSVDERCECGHKGSSQIGRIFYGTTDSLPYAYPWHVLLKLQPSLSSSFGSSTTRHYCSSTIINSLLLLTSGNCVSSFSDDETTVLPLSVTEVKAIASVYLATEDNEDPNAQTLDIESIIIHPEFLKPKDITVVNAYDYDIALIKLKTPIDFVKNKKMQPACIPDSEDVIYFEKEHIESDFSGWKQMQNSSRYSAVLKNMGAHLSSVDFCKANTKAYSERIHCGEGSHQPIDSFSGGAVSLKMKAPDRWLQVGIISHKITTWIKGNQIDTNFYTNIKSYVPFIDEISEKMGATWCKKGDVDSDFSARSTQGIQGRSFPKTEDKNPKIEKEKRLWVWQSGKRSVNSSCAQEYDLKYCNCGRRGSTNSISKSRVAANYEFPWHVHLIVTSKERYQGYHGCSASIINDLVLITSANCVVTKIGNIILPSLIRAEFFAIDDVNGTNPTFPIEEIIVHPEFLNSSSHEIINSYDIALLKLKDPLTFKKKHYRPICLPELGENIKIIDGVVGTTLSWSLVNEDDNDIVDKKATARLLKNEIQLRNDNYCHMHHQQSGTICVDYDLSNMENDDDFGKGLFLPSETGSHMMHIGIASFKISSVLGGHPHYLEYFRKIDGFIDFIYHYSDKWGASWCQKEMKL